MSRTVIKEDVSLLLAFVRRELNGFREFREASNEEQHKIVVKYTKLLHEHVDECFEKHLMRNLSINILSNMGSVMYTLTMPGNDWTATKNGEINFPPATYAYLPFQENAAYALSFDLVEIPR